MLVYGYVIIIIIIIDIKSIECNSETKNSVGMQWLTRDMG